MGGDEKKTSKKPTETHAGKPGEVYTKVGEMTKGNWRIASLNVTILPSTFLPLEELSIVVVIVVVVTAATAAVSVVVR